MNTITELFNGYSPAEQAALQVTHDQLAPEWDAAASYKFARILVATPAFYSARFYTVANIGVNAVN